MFTEEQKELLRMQARTYMMIALSLEKNGIDNSHYLKKEIECWELLESLDNVIRLVA